MGLKTCNRRSYPDLIRKQSSRFKKGLVALLVAGSIAITAGIYNSMPDKESPYLGGFLQNKLGYMKIIIILKNL